MFPHGSSHTQDDRDGAQCLCHAAHAGGLLPDQAMTPPQFLVRQAGGHFSHPQLGDDVGCPCHRRVQFAGADHAEGCLLGGGNPAGEPAHHLQPLRIGVHQPEFLQIQHPGARQETLQQFRCVGGSSSNYGDFHDRPPAVG